MLKNKKTRALILVMVALVLTGLGIASVYYGNINKWKDPRVQKANELYDQYGALVAAEDYPGIMALMDSVEDIYRNIPHYKKSYETGVLDNNRSAVWLTLALMDSSSVKKERILALLDTPADSLLRRAENSINSSIRRYTSWLARYDSLNDVEIKTELRKDFFTGFHTTGEKEREKYLESRMKEIKTALVENKRRLSVSYTNLGLVYRLREDYQQAGEYYLEALELWDRNLTAENNLNILLNKPLKKRNFIQKMFPPSKQKQP